MSQITRFNTLLCVTLLATMTGAAGAYAHAASIERYRGEFIRALDLIDRASEILKNAVKDDSGIRHLGELSSVTLLRADILLGMGENVEAL